MGITFTLPSRKRYAVQSKAGAAILILAVKGRCMF